MLENPYTMQSEGINRQFATTQWSVVLAAGEEAGKDGEKALADLCETYWYPLYAYIRRRVRDANEAQDLTQAFFERLLEKKSIAMADPDRGRFRSFLLTACKRFLINEQQKRQAFKRGGGERILSLDFDSGESRYAITAVDDQTPDRLYEQQWAVTLLRRVLEKLRQEYVDKDKREHFDQMKQFLAGAPTTTAYTEVAVQLSMTATAVRVAAHRLRSRYREIIRAEIAETVEDAGDVEDEIRQLFVVLGGNVTSAQKV